MAPRKADVPGLVASLRFLWLATRGHRLRPARSPYLRWRLETFTGKAADEVRFADFVALFWRERRQMARFGGWLAELRSLTSAGQRISR